MSNCNAYLYANDTVLYCMSNTPQAAINTLQQSFDHFQHSRLDLKLVLNADKIKFMVFSRARNIAEDGFHITTLTGDSIEQVSECKYLDIRLDKKLTFKFHI